MGHDHFFVLSKDQCIEDYVLYSGREENKNSLKKYYFQYNKNAIVKLRSSHQRKYCF